MGSTESSLQGPEGLKPRSWPAGLSLGGREEPSLLDYWKNSAACDRGSEVPISWLAVSWGPILAPRQYLIPHHLISPVPSSSQQRHIKSFPGLKSDFPLPSFLFDTIWGKLSAFKVSQDNLPFFRSTLPHKVTQPWGFTPQSQVLGIQGCETLGALPGNSAHYINWNDCLNLFIEMIEEWQRRLTVQAKEQPPWFGQDWEL